LICLRKDASLTAKGTGPLAIVSRRPGLRGWTRQSVDVVSVCASREMKPVTTVSSLDLIEDDYFLVETGIVIPTDGEIVGRVASVDESAVTGESAP